MAAALRRFCSPSLLSYRGLSTAPVLYAKGKGAEEPVKKLFLDKLAEFKSQGNVRCVNIQKQDFMVFLLGPNVWFHQERIQRSSSKTQTCIWSR